MDRDLKVIHGAEELFAAMDAYFFDEDKLKYCRIFAKTGQHERGYSTGQQLEGWFKGELIYLFSTLQREQRIQEWKSEASEPGIGQIDFKVSVEQQPLYLEIKVAYLGMQGKSPFNPAYYLNSGKTSTEVAKDVRKLKELAHSAKCFCVVFVYPSPSSPEVQKQVQKKPRGWDTWEICLTRLCQKMEAEEIHVQDSTPFGPERNEHLYIARLEVSRLSPGVVETE